MRKIVLVPLAVMALSLCGCEKIETEYQWVDLGLSVKWAKVNVGSTTISGYGDYFAWGEVSPKECYTAENYKWYDNDGHIIKYCSNISYDDSDYLTELLPEDDVAALEWGNGWRMPKAVLTNMPLHSGCTICCTRQMPVPKSRLSSPGTVK